MYNYNAKVERVLDADSMLLQIDLGFNIKIQHVVRLLGVDAFETRQIRGNTLDEVAKGKEGKEFMKSLLLGKNVLIRTIKDSSDKYGRYLCHMELQTDEGVVNINDEVVLRGFGKRI